MNSAIASAPALLGFIFRQALVFVVGTMHYIGKSCVLGLVQQHEFKN